MSTHLFQDTITTEIIPKIVARIRQNYQQYGASFPSYGDGDKQYLLTSNENWLASFWTGLLWLIYAETGHEQDLTNVTRLLSSFENRLTNRIRLNHDLGFLFLLSARAQYLLQGDVDAQSLMLRAADELYARYRPDGQYIQAWGELDNDAEAGRIIIDCMMNLPLLFLATHETGNQKYHDAALAHAKKSQAYLIREDASTYHTYFFNPVDGSPIAPKTHQGFADDSLWARGQGWAIYGFTMAAEWTGDETFISTAQDAVERYFAEAPINNITPYDLRLTDDALAYPDSSADAIVAGGLLRLADLTGEQAYREKAHSLLMMLYEKAFDTQSDAQGLLLHGTQHAPHNYGVDTYTIFGDYFFLEGLMRLTSKAPDFWGKPQED
ncbi:MAG: glycoside hydrolase family 88 protein [Chloroflexota bacterium]